MTTQVIATVVNGMLKPDSALSFPEQARVKVTIEPLVEPMDPVQAWRELNAWIDQNPLHGLGPHPTRDELYERR